MRGTTPPRGALRLLERGLPVLDRDELIGDLNEEFGERAARSRLLAAAWYWTEAIALIVARRPLARATGLPPDVAARRLWADAGADWRLAWRSLRHAPGFAFVALLSMTLSLGLATAVFSIVNNVLLHPVPLPNADRLVRLGTITPGVDTGRQARITSVGALPPPPGLRDLEVGAWLARRRALGPLATYEVGPSTIVLGDESMRTGVAMVGAEFFDVFPVRARAGRTLTRTDADRTAAAVAVISERLTGPRTADASTVIGRTLTIDSRPYEVAGVLPLDFEWPVAHADVWIADRTVWPTPDMPRNFGRTTLAFGVMHPGATPEEVRREGQRMAEEIHALRPDPRATGTPFVVARLLADELLAPVWPALMLLTFGTFGVVIAANVNLAGFLMARSTTRRRDQAVRRALGASRWRVVRPIFFEQLLLAGAGAIGAMLLAYWVLRALPAVAPPDLPRLADVALDRASFFFTWTSAVLTALFVGLTPASMLPRASLREVTSEGGAAVAHTSRAAESLRSALVITQIAVAALLLVCSVLVARSLLGMLRIDTGYRSHGVLTFQVGVTPAPLQPGRVWNFYETLQSRLRSHPDVVATGLSDALPLHGDTLRSTFVAPGITPPPIAGTPAPTAHIEAISATYLQTIGATLTRGRFFTEQDVSSGEPVAIVNEAFVRTFLPGVDPIGQILPRGVRRHPIVGVIAPIKRAASTVDDDPAFYTLFTPARETLMALFSSMGVAVRTTGDPMALAPVVRDVVRELAPGAPVHNVMALDARVQRTFAQPRFFAVALTLFAALALATALVGVYGALAASVHRRRVELGVRRALGATTADVARLVVRRALMLAALGLTAGSFLAAVLAALGRSRLYGVTPLDAASYAAAAALILIVVLAGALVPIRRAVRIDPVRVLRAE